MGNNEIKYYYGNCGLFLTSVLCFTQFYVCSSYENSFKFCDNIIKTPDIIKNEYSINNFSDRYYISGFNNTNSTVSAIAPEIIINY